MDKLTVISGCLFLAADIFAIASIANPDWINTGESAGKSPRFLFTPVEDRDRQCAGFICLCTIGQFWVILLNFTINTVILI